MTVWSKPIQVHTLKPIQVLPVRIPIDSDTRIEHFMSIVLSFTLENEI